MPRGSRTPAEPGWGLTSDFDADLLETHGMTSLLFETPTGFAVFNFYAIGLYVPNAIESIWLNFAEHFLAEDVPHNVNEHSIKYSVFLLWHLARHILPPGASCWGSCTSKFSQDPKKKLLVGKPEYKSIIEKSLGISCLHNELVMEVMWGMKHLMHKLVPGEKSQLSMEDHPPMSQGLQILLRRYAFDVEPEMVNEQIVATARILFKCDDVEKKEYQNLCLVRHYLKKVSGIDYESWDPLKLATAFKIISRSEAGDSDKMFPEDVISKLLSDADKYDAKINKVACLRTYSQVASAHRVRAFKRSLGEES